MRAGLLGLVLAASAAAACGKVGPPVAPETRLPQPVADLQAVVENEAVVLTWTHPTRRVDDTPLREATEARVYRSEDDGQGQPRAALLRRGRIAGWDEVSTIKIEGQRPGARAPREQQLRIADREGLVPGRRYSYVVLTEDAQGRVSTPSRRASVVLLATPEPPVGLTAVPGEGEVRLAWEAPSRLSDGSLAPGSLTYEVLRSADPATPGQSITPSPLATTTFVDRGVQNDRTYHYTVRALREDNGSLARGTPTAPESATPRDMTPPAPPGELVAIPAPGSVRLSWRASPDTDVASYRVYRAPAGQPLARVGGTPATRNVHVDDDVAPGTYQYAVTAVDAAARPNESARSNIVTVTVPARGR